MFAYLKLLTKDARSKLIFAVYFVRESGAVYFLKGKICSAKENLKVIMKKSDIVFAPIKISPYRLVTSSDVAYQP